MSELINKPKHYEICDGKDAIDIIDDILKRWPDGFLNKQDYSLYGQVLQYLIRAGNKNELEDFKKGHNLLGRLIDRLEDPKKNCYS